MSEAYNEHVRGMLREAAQDLAEQTQRSKDCDPFHAMERERDDALAKLAKIEAVIADPAAVWVNMLRGTIAMPQHVQDYEGRVYELQRRCEDLQREIEGAAWRITPAMADAAIDGHVARIAKLEAYIAKLEKGGDAMLQMLRDEGWESTAQNAWTEARKVKP